MPSDLVAPESSPERKPEIEERLQIFAQNIFRDDINLSEKQIDEVLSQRREINNYLHTERMQRHERFKIQTKDRKLYFFVVLVFSLVVMIARPEYFTQVLSVLLGFLGGYGIAKKDAEDQAVD